MFLHGRCSRWRRRRACADAFLCPLSSLSPRTGPQDTDRARGSCGTAGEERGGWCAWQTRCAWAPRLPGPQGYRRACGQAGSSRTRGKSWPAGPCGPPRAAGGRGWRGSARAAGAHRSVRGGHVRSDWRAQLPGHLLQGIQDRQQHRQRARRLQRLQPQDVVVGVGCDCAPAGRSARAHPTSPIRQLRARTACLRWQRGRDEMLHALLPRARNACLPAPATMHLNARRRWRALAHPLPHPYTRR